VNLCIKTNKYKVELNPKPCFTFLTEEMLTKRLFAFKVEEIVENGEIPLEDVHLPGVYVKGLLKGSQYQKRIEVS